MLTKIARPAHLRQFIRTFASSSDLSSAKAAGVVKRDKLQFSKKRLTDWGELPPGEIPDALQYDRPFELSSLGNGVKVASESWKSQLATVLVNVKSGSRNETLETSGASQFLKNLSQRGTPSRNRTQFESDLTLLGGNLTVDVGRESTVFALTVQPKDVAFAVELLGDIVKNPLLDKNQVEAEREEIYRNASENHRDQMNATLEAAHFTSYRDHFLGQPVLGIRENIGSITRDQLKEFHEGNFVGNNVTVVATGNVNPEQIKDLANKHFGTLRKEGPTAKNSETPFFTPSTMFMRDDEMANVNVGVFFKAPTWKDPEYFALKLIQFLLGEYQANKYTGAHLNSSSRQYNTIHTWLGNYPDVSLHKCFYFPYQDTALFGSYLMGNEIFGYQLLYLSQYILTEYASYINQAELFRARNAFYNYLLNIETTSDVASKLATQIQYLGRRVPRSEFAKRLSYMDVEYLQRVISEWFWDTDISVAAWGPLHAMMTLSHYNRPLRRSTLGWYGASHIHVV